MPGVTARCAVILLYLALASAAETRQKVETTACASGPNFVPLFEDVEAAKQRLEAAGKAAHAALSRAESGSSKLEVLETHREEFAKNVASASAALSAEAQALEELRKETADLRTHVAKEQSSIDITINRLGPRRASLQTRRDKLNYEAKQILRDETELNRLSHSIDGLDIWRVKRREERLLRKKQFHAQRAAALDRESRSMERSTGELEARVKHWHHEQQTLSENKERLRSKIGDFKGHQSELAKAEDSLARLEAQTMAQIKVNRELAARLRKARAASEEASKEVINLQGNVMNKLHSKYTEQKADIGELFKDVTNTEGELQSTQGALEGVRTELGARDASISDLRAAVRKTKEGLQACEDRSVPEHLQDELSGFAGEIDVPDPAPSPSDAFMRKLDSLSNSLAGARAASDDLDPAPPAPAPSGDAPPDVQDMLGKLRQELMKR